MAFPTEEPIVPTGWNGVHIELYFSNVSDNQAGRIRISLTYSDGQSREKDFDLLARLQDDSAGLTHLSNLLALKNYLVSRIESELLA